jgi:membrane associated rhomboid family serine protease
MASRAREPFLRLPAGVTALAAVLVAAHLVRILAPPRLSGWILATFAFFPSRYDKAYLAAHGGNAGTSIEQAIPFLSYNFLHANWQHLAINCVWLLPFGTVVARRFGTTLFILFFLLSGIGGAAIHLALNWGSPVPVIGASAAISGCMAAAFRMMGPSSKLAPILSGRVVLWSGIWTFINIVAGVTGLGADGHLRLVAWQAHLGGYFAGLLAAGPFDSVSTLIARRMNRRRSSA